MSDQTEVSDQTHWFMNVVIAINKSDKSNPSSIKIHRAGVLKDSKGTPIVCVDEFKTKLNTTITKGQFFRKKKQTTEEDTFEMPMLPSITKTKIPKIPKKSQTSTISPPNPKPPLETLIPMEPTGNLHTVVPLLSSNIYLEENVSKSKIAKMDNKVLKKTPEEIVNDRLKQAMSTTDMLFDVMRDIEIEKKKQKIQEDKKRKIREEEEKSSKRVGSVKMDPPNARVALVTGNICKANEFQPELGTIKTDNIVEILSKNTHTRIALNCGELKKEVSTLMDETLRYFERILKITNFKKDEKKPIKDIDAQVRSEIAQFLNCDQVARLSELSNILEYEIGKIRGMMFHYCKIYMEKRIRPYKNKGSKIIDISDMCAIYTTICSSMNPVDFKGNRFVFEHAKPYTYKCFTRDYTYFMFDRHDPPASLYLELPLAYFAIEAPQKKHIIDPKNRKPEPSTFEIISCETYYKDAVKVLQKLPVVRVPSLSRQVVSTPPPPSPQQEKSLPTPPPSFPDQPREEIITLGESRSNE